MNASPFLSLKGICKSFRAVKANDQIDLEVFRERCTLSWGERAGKSTLMKILYGFYRADSGRSGSRESPSRSALPTTRASSGSEWSSRILSRSGFDRGGEHRPLPARSARRAGQTGHGETDRRDFPQVRTRGGSPVACPAALGGRTAEGGDPETSPSGYANPHPR